MGDGTTTDRHNPGAVDLGDGRTAKVVGLGSAYTCVILDDDSLKCWGHNDFGQLGDGTGTVSPRFVDLGESRSAKAVSFGHQHGCAILDDDSLKCWGDSDDGKMGVPTGHRGDDPNEMGDNLPAVNLD